MKTLYRLAIVIVGLSGLIIGGGAEYVSDILVGFSLFVIAVYMGSRSGLFGKAEDYHWDDDDIDPPLV